MRIESRITQAGLDNHKNFSRLTGRDSSGKIIFRQRLEHKDRRALREDLRQLPPGTPVVLEGTFGWGWMSDELKECELDPHLASSRKTAAWREARGMAKNNKLDADLLSELWSQPERWWEVWLAPPEVRGQREWLRYRMALVRTQTSLKNRIHATLHRHGVLHEFSDLFGKKGLVFLKGLCQVGPSRRFANHRKLAAYALLAPRADDSGDEDGPTPTGRCVGHNGGLTLKWAFIEAARGAVRKSGHFRELFDRRTDGGKRDRGRGYIAVGHELSRVGLSCCHYERNYSEQRPARPGSLEDRPARWARKMQEEQMRLREKEINKNNESELPQVSRPGTGGPYKIRSA